MSQATLDGGLIAVNPLQMGTRAQLKYNELYLVLGYLNNAQASMVATSAMTGTTQHVTMLYWMIRRRKGGYLEGGPTIGALQSTTIRTDSLIVPLTFTTMST